MPLGKVITLQVDWFNQQNTARFYRKLRAVLRGWRIDVVRDQAPWHRGAEVRETAVETWIHEPELPAYSPELHAAEPWIRWLKESVDDNICWEEMGRLVRSFNGLVASLSHRREEVLRRCVPQTLGINCG